MSSSSPPPPPPPDPTRNNPFDKSSCSNSRPSPTLRRAKTLSNPENETTWRREPLLDITNAYLTRDSPPRLQRVPLAHSRRASDDLALSPSPSPSRLARGVPMRRTRSEVPQLSMMANTMLPSSTTPLFSQPLPSSPSTPLVRELRPRTRSSTALEPPSPTPSLSSAPSTSSPALETPGLRRTRRSTSSGPATPITPRRRTFGGLSSLPEDPLVDDMTSEIGGSEASENEHRRLRRRRSTGASSTQQPGKKTPSRSGLR
ncbi:uncharacterized protein JCM15063_002676 [Sporobolomyces koalae]|uniref:uncharacterized protein n=1 Tax=Sporobolomyces koalae TaxID=500713 RepID=UPI003171A39D